MDQSPDKKVEEVFKKYHIDKNRMRSTLERKLNPQKSKVFNNMKKEFLAHLNDKREDSEQRYLKNVNCVRQRFQTLLMQIPSDVQNLTLEDIQGKGGSIDFLVEDNCQLQLKLQIPKNLVKTSTLESIKNCKSLPESASKPKNTFKEPQRSVTKSSSTVKAPQKLNISRVMTRSAAKSNAKKEDQAIGTVVNDLVPKTSNGVSPRKETLMKTLGIPKTLREPKENEEIVTLAFSTTGTPLVMDNKNVERLNNN